MTVLTTAMTSPALEINLPLEKKLDKKSHRVTDEGGFIVFFIIMFLTFGIPRIVNYSQIIIQYHQNNSTEADKSLENIQCINLSTVKILHSFSLINFTITGLENDEMLRESGIWRLTEILDAGMFYFCVPWILYRIITLFINSTNPEYNAHYIIVNMSKVMVSTFFMITLDASSYGQFSIAILIPLLETALTQIICQIILFFTALAQMCMVLKGENKFVKKFRSILRFYAACRCLILYQFFNFMTMIFLLAWPVVITNYLCVKHLDAGILLGNGFLICLLHEYSKMVIMLATALQKDQGDDTVSFKTILSSMIIISRYHLGTVIINAPIIWHMMHTTHMACLYVHGTKIDKTIMKYSSILTAVYGRNFEKAERTVLFLIAKGRLIEYKTKTLIIWKDAMSTSIPLVYLITSSNLSPTSSLSKYVILLAYLIATSIYFYVVVTVVNIFEKTVTICEIVKSKDFEIVDNERQFQAVINDYKDFQKKNSESSSDSSSGLP